MGNQKKKRKGRRIHPLFYIAVVLLFLNLILLGEVLGLRKELANAVLGETETAVSGRSAVSTFAQESEEELAAQAREIYEANEDLLVLVNKEHKIPDDYQVKLKLLNNGRFYVAKVLHSDLVQMLDDADEQGYSYYLVSGYRDSEYQQGLVDNDVEMYMEDYGMSYEEALAKTYEQVMPAGYSEHETGLALDITAANHVVLDESQASEPPLSGCRRIAGNTASSCGIPRTRRTSRKSATSPGISVM
ncbi:MAG: D-alanyl-D-alanine carboxypeptidase family protein [Lachnospiraceae bacterium]|nr:D-alanyl-D-alanine carboxypeptidase family protein [Lachnospiraceae bacterium]